MRPVTATDQTGCACRPNLSTAENKKKKKNFSKLSFAYAYPFTHQEVYFCIFYSRADKIKSSEM